MASAGQTLEISSSLIVSLCLRWQASLCTVCIDCKRAFVSRASRPHEMVKRKCSSTTKAARKAAGLGIDKGSCLRLGIEFGGAFVRPPRCHQKVTEHFGARSHVTDTRHSAVAFETSFHPATSISSSGSSPSWSRRSTSRTTRYHRPSDPC